MKRAGNNTRGHRVTVSPCHRVIRSRPGFTLVELMVVVAIIGILVALAAGAVVRYISAQAKDSTETAIRKLQPKLQARWKSVVDQASKEAIHPSALGMANGDEQIARVIYIKLRLRQEFPMNFNEAVDPSPLPPIQEYRETVWRAIPGLRNQTPPASADLFQNSACLLMALTRATKGQSLEAADLGSTFVADSNNDGAQELIDAWGKPILFIRFPYQDQFLNPGGPLPGLHDDIDTHGHLANRAWLGSGGRGQFQTLLHPVPDNPPPSPAPNRPHSYKLFPIIVSSGQNGLMGLNFNGGVVGNVNDSNDNIYSYNLMKLGARGD